MTEWICIQIHFGFRSDIMFTQNERKIRHTGIVVTLSLSCFIGDDSLPPSPDQPRKCVLCSLKNFRFIAHHRLARSLLGIFAARPKREVHHQVSYMSETSVCVTKSYRFRRDSGNCGPQRVTPLISIYSKFFNQKSTSVAIEEMFSSCCITTLRIPALCRSTLST